MHRASHVHIVELLFVFPPFDGGAGGVGSSNLPLTERRHQQHVKRPVHVRQETQPLLQMDSRRYFHITLACFYQCSISLSLSSPTNDVEGKKNRETFETDGVTDLKKIKVRMF